MFLLPDSWVWDLWVCDDGADYHLFFLFASRALHDPEARHRRASIGHAVSADLRSWHRVTDVVVRGDPPAFDDLSTWTGSVTRAPDGSWFLFYTGGSDAAGETRQSIGAATSVDLKAWTKLSANPILRIDSRWYADLVDGEGGDFRDPWVFPDPDGAGWHMLLTAKAAGGPYRDTGVIGHAMSPDLQCWQLLAPLTHAGAGFSQLEVLQVEQVHGRWVVIFSCLGVDTAPERAATGVRAGVWAASADTPLGPFHLENAYPLTDETLYSGRLIRIRDTDDWCFLAFCNRTPEGKFGGWIIDPISVAWSGDRLVLAPG